MAQIRNGIPNNISADCRVVMPFSRHNWSFFLNAFGLMLYGDESVASKELQSEIFKWIRENLRGKVFHVEYYKGNELYWEFFCQSPGDALALRMRFC